MLEELKARLSKLSKTTLQIYAQGNYPKGTIVQHVAKWQNDGTDRGVTPARFVEAAEKQAKEWRRAITEAVDWFLSGDETVINSVGFQISQDIGRACNRIRTGQLKSSFEYRIIDEP